MRARLRVPGDKSITHRALILNAIAEGTAEVRGVAPGRDAHATVSALLGLGGSIRWVDDDRVVVTGGARWSSEGPIDCENSGTTARLLLGVLAARATRPVTLIGDRSLSRRPMARIVEPLSEMGAEIVPAARDRAAGSADRLPLVVSGQPLRGTEHHLPIASAQVKSAILLAGLAAVGKTTLVEPVMSRDHTERMLRVMGAQVAHAGTRVVLEPGPLVTRDVDIPGDLSSAAPFLALAAARRGGEVIVERVGVNPSRTGFLDVLRAFGARVEIEDVAGELEPRGTVRVKGRGLKGVTVTGADVVRSVDELPLVAVIATQAEGITHVTGAEELRVKESDRISGIVTALRRMGADIEAEPDGFRVRGPTRLVGARVDAMGDHRIGMALSVAAALASSESQIVGAECVAISYPGFFRDLARFAGTGRGA